MNKLNIHCEHRMDTLNIYCEHAMNMLNIYCEHARSRLNIYYKHIRNVEYIDCEHTRTIRNFLCEHTRYVLNIYCEHAWNVLNISCEHTWNMLNVYCEHTMNMMNICCEHSMNLCCSGTRIRKSGGSYTYIREAFGDLVGFVFLWTHLIIVRPMAAAVGAMAAAEYILRPEFLECPELTPRAGKTLIAICILCAYIIWTFMTLRSFLGVHDGYDATFSLVV